MNEKSRAVTDQAATSVSPRQHSVPNHTFPVFMQQKPTKGKKKHQAQQTMEKASEGEDNSRARFYLAVTKALKNC